MGLPVSIYAGNPVPSVRPHQEPRTIRVKNNTGDDVLVYRKGTYPGASPEFVRRLRSHSSFEKSRGFGVTFVYKPANGIGQIQEVEMITQESGKNAGLDQSAQQSPQR